MMKLQGLVAATHTPFDSSGELNLAVVEKQAEHLERDGVSAVFVGGTTGESSSLTVVERLALAKRWSEAVRGSGLNLIVHVGSNCLTDSRSMAAHAESIGARAISAVGPSYFKPKNLEVLVDCCVEIAGAAPATPFYFYDIPAMTGMHFSMPDFLELAAKRVPTLAGIKFTNPDLMAYQRCLRAVGGTLDAPWGMDELLLAALALGATGAVGSSYNFAAPIYRRVMKAFAAGDLVTARNEQFRSVQLIELLASFGYMAAAKAVMGMLGVDVGEPRLPNAKLDASQHARLRTALDELGYFGWR